MSDSGKDRPHQVRRQPVHWLLLNVLLLSMVGVLSLSYPVEELSRRAGDFYFRLRENQGTSPDVALVLIDDASLERYGRWPWKRSLLARVVRAASAERPKALGLDILLSEPEDESDDRELAVALQDAGNAVLVGKIGNSPEGRLWVEPMTLFAEKAIAVGHAQAALGPDSICRSVPVRELSLEGPRWAFALEVARVARGAPLEDDGREVRVGGRRIPAVQTSSHAAIAGAEFESPRLLLIDYRGQTAPGETSPAFSAVSVVDLLEGKTGGQLQRKAVLIGFGSAEIGDRIPTPVSGRLPMPGVEIHANLVDAILAGRSLRPLNGWLSLLLLCLFSSSFTWVVLRWPVWKGLIALAVLLASGLVASYLAFAWMHLLRHLQAELSSLYAFDETLLEAMQEGLAVFASDGRLIFRNPQWQSFCEKQGWRADSSLDNFVAGLREAPWGDIRKLLVTPGVWLDAEVNLGQGLWQLRAVKLKSTSAADPSEVVMVVATDQTVRLERDRARAEALGFVT